MPHSTLLRALARMAADHALAGRLGKDVEQVRDERRAAAERDALLSRRQFLTGLAVGGAGLVLGPSLGGAIARAATAPRIAIVGGGIAGLTAALTLADAGYASTVYESSGRLGGRMFSHNNGYWADGQVSEWCGELIDTRHKLVQSLCRRFGLPLDDLKAAQAAGSEETYYFDGAYYTDVDRGFQSIQHALNKAIQQAGYPTLYDSSTPAGYALDQTSIYDWIEQNVPGGHGSALGALLDDAYCIEYGADTREQSSLSMLYLLGYNSSAGNFRIFGPSDERYHIRGGNQRLPLAIAASLPAGSVRTGTRLQRIARTAAGSVTLSFWTATGTLDVTADHVILAIPFAVLQGLDTAAAGFDALKNTAIQELGRGQNGKLMVQFASRLWATPGPWGLSTGTTYADTGYQNTWEVSRGQPGASGMLVQYTGGSGTTGQFSPRAPFNTIGADSRIPGYVGRFLGQLEPVLPGITPLWNGKAALSIPPMDPNFNCSYSYWKVGQYTRFSGYERAAQGNIHFAGEHCSVDFQGYMEGGATEGQRAASEILAALKK